MRLDLLTLGLMGEAPGSWPGLMGLAELDTERYHGSHTESKLRHPMLFRVIHIVLISLSKEG